MKRISIGLFLALALVVLMSWMNTANATSGLFTSNCTSCHAATPTTCNGCHAHGTHPSSAKNGINVAGATDKGSYNVGDTVTVTINGGYRTGWVRAILYDQTGKELARSTGTATGGMGGGAGYPITLSGTATTAGTYTWSVAWYGNQYDITGAAFGTSWTTDPNNPNHGEEVVATNSFTVAAAAPAPAPAINLNPATLNFATVNVGGSVTQTTQIQNTGTGALNVSGIALCSGTSTEFSSSPAAPLTVNAAGSVTLSVTYTPTNAGTDTGCLQITSNASTSPTSLQLSGTGNVPAPAAQPAINLNPASLTFSNVTVGNAPAQTVRIQNTGNAALNVSGLTLAAGTSAEFTFSPAAPFSIAAGADQAVTVTYKPTNAGTDTGSLQVASNDPAKPSVSLALTGTGVALPPPPPATQPGIRLNPNALNFGNITVGGQSATMTTQIQNTGSADLNVTGIALCSGTSTEFTFSPTAPLTVAAGSSATLSVSYSPLTAANDAGCLQIASNDPANASVNLALTATGVAPPPPAQNPEPALSLNPAALDYGTVTVGSSASKTAVVRNTGTADLIVSRVALCAGTSSEFTFTPASFTVAAGTSRNLAVTYKPTNEGADTGCLELTTNTASPATVNVTGTGAVAAPQTGTQPGTGDIDIRNFSATREVKLSEGRSVRFRLAVINRSRTNAASPATLVGTQDGVEVYNQTVTVTARARRTVDVSFPTYTPTTAGTIRWVVTIDDQDPDIDKATATTRVEGSEEDDD